MTSQKFTYLKILFVVTVSAGLLWIAFGSQDDAGNIKKPIKLVREDKTKPPRDVPFEVITTGASKRIIYVDLKGSDDQDGSAPEKALKTIQSAIEKAQPGDGIKLADGEYFQDFITVRDGRFDDPIAILGSPRAIIRGGGGVRVIQVAHDYIMLEGFTVDGLFGDAKSPDGYRDKLIYLQSETPLNGVEGVKLKDLNVRNAGGECIRVKYFAKHNEISGNTIEGCGIRDFVFDRGKKNGEGIYIGTAPEQVEDGKNPSEDVDASSENWIHHNRINTRGNECVDIKEGSLRNLVEYNDCTGQKDDDSAGLDARGNLNTFRNNVVYGNVGSGIRLGGDKDDQGINNSVYDNEIRDNKGGGIKVMRFPQSNLCNNRFKDNDKDDFVGEYADEAEKSLKTCD